MKKETEGYVSDNWYDTNLIEDAKPFETRTKAYEYMRKNCLDKEYVIVEVK